MDSTLRINANADSSENSNPKANTRTEPFKSKLQNSKTKILKREIKNLLKNKINITNK